MNSVIVTTYKTRKAAEKFAAVLANVGDDGTYWNGSEFVEVGPLNFRAIKQDGVWLVVRNWCVADLGRSVNVINL
jgi:hypothetical protein